MQSYIERFSPAIMAAGERDAALDPTLGGRLLIHQERGLQVSYAPFEHVQRGARVAIVGITPGRTQAVAALAELRRRLAAGDTHAEALAAAKVHASFAGTMRKYLVETMDHVGLARWLGVASTASLWDADSRFAHFTSALRYPVFVGEGANYNGTPDMVATPALRDMLDTCLAEEARTLPDAVWVPLGGKAAAGVAHLVRTGVLDPARVLDGLPHPSGANAERVAFYVGRKPAVRCSRQTDTVTLSAARDRTLRLVEALRPFPTAPAT